MSDATSIWKDFRGPGTVEGKLFETNTWKTGSGSLSGKDTQANEIRGNLFDPQSWKQWAEDRPRVIGNLFQPDSWTTAAAAPAVTGNLSQPSTWKPGKADEPTPTPADIDGLVQRVADPKAVAFFDQRFGEGSAVRYLEALRSAHAAEQREF